VLAEGERLADQRRVRAGGCADDHRLHLVEPGYLGQAISRVMTSQAEAPCDRAGVVRSTVDHAHDLVGGIAPHDRQVAVQAHPSQTDRRNPEGLGLL